jgi:septal ring factor EnvC (AmiA/AmiB activator)
MKKILLFFSLLFIVEPQVFGASELSKINAQIKQTEQQNKKLEQQVKTSDREVSRTKKDLVQAADRVSTLEEQRAEMTKKIAELDAQRDKINSDMNANKGRISDAAASILFVASHPSFDSESMREYVLTSAILSGVADRLEDGIVQAQQQLDDLEKIRDARAIEKEKLDRTAKKYTRQKKELDKLLRTRSAQNEKLKSQHLALQKNYVIYLKRRKVYQNYLRGWAAQKCRQILIFHVVNLIYLCEGMLLCDSQKKRHWG